MVTLFEYVVFLILVFESGLKPFCDTFPPLVELVLPPMLLLSLYYPPELSIDPLEECPPPV